jgi:8-oxo-dGTP pyrophosphatase MutT (NUDIX family)
VDGGRGATTSRFLALCGRFGGGAEGGVGAVLSVARHSLRDVTATVNNDAPRAQLLDVLARIVPLDELEREHLESTRAWVTSGADLYRSGAIDVPPTHLVVYFVPQDTDGRQVLLVAHRKADLWLPAGGHVEVGEDPWRTVTRECEEELHTPAVTSPATGPHPLFLSVNRTRRGAMHTDVALWYLLDADPAQITSYDEAEFADVRWWPLDALRERLATPTAAGFEPHLSRFLDKLASLSRPVW